MISERPHAAAISSSEAVKKLYEWRDIDFQSELVEEFIQAIGIYPAGSLVELSDGSVAIVTAAGRQQRLRPKIMIVLDHEKQTSRDMKIIDLMQVHTDANDKPLNISKSLPNDAYGIDPEEFYI